MAETTNVFNPATGKVEAIDTSSLGRAAEATGSHELSAREQEAWNHQQAEDARGNNFIESQIAGGVGKVRGLGEAVGIPTDAIAGSVGDAFGKGDTVRGYINDLNRYHPIASTLGEIGGQTGGAIAAGELMGGGGGGGGLVSRLAEAGARGGLENLVASSTHDINESALGNADLAGEKLFAQMPKHFAAGFTGGIIGGAVGEGVGAAFSKLGKELPGALDNQANRLVGKEFGGDAALGAELRAHVGGVPKSSSEVTSALREEQSAFRKANQAETLASKDALAAKQTTEAAKLSAEQEARRARVLKESQAAIEELQSQHKAAREALDAQHGEAASAATKLESELNTARQQVKNLAGDLDKVKGATLPDSLSILREANAQLAPGASLTPPSPTAQALFNEWADTFAAKYKAKDSLKFTDLQNVIDGLSVMERRQRVVSGWGEDPDVAKTFAALKSAAQSEFDRASEATAASVSEAKSLSAARLRETIPQLEQAHANALEHVENIQGTIGKFDRIAATELKMAQREAAAQARQFERGVRTEDRAFDQASRAEEKAIPKASKETPVDTLLGKVKKPTEKPGLLESMGSTGLLVSLLHGNVAGAAMSAAGSFAAKTAASHGNLLAARTLSGLSDMIASSDGAIARLAGRATGKYVRQGIIDKAEDDHKPAPRSELTFDKVAKGVRDAQANPLILEQRVRQVAGPWAQQAPAVYASLLASQQRMQAFLESKLPLPRTDSLSPTPQLEHDDLSDSEKYDFLQYAKGASDPIQAMRDVVDGHGTEQQVEAVEAVYPGLYKQTQEEVKRALAMVRSPLDYERLNNIGTLLQMDTSEVMTGDFQSMQSDMYSSRENSEKVPGGSKPRGVNSRLSKSMMSAGDQIAANGEV